MRGLSSEYVDGKWIPYYADPVDILIIVPQPVKSNELRQLPEGEFRRNWRKTWLSGSIKMRDGEQDSDVLIYQGRWYKVFQVDDRRQLGNYQRAMIYEDPPPWVVTRFSDNTVMLGRGPARRPMIFRTQMERDLE